MRCAAVKKALVRTGDTRSTHYDVPPDEADNEEPKEKQCGGHSAFSPRCRIVARPRLMFRGRG